MKRFISAAPVFSGEKVIILGSGPSLDGFDFRALSGRKTIAVNDAGTILYPCADVLIGTDRRWWNNLAHRWRGGCVGSYLGPIMVCTEPDAAVGIEGDKRLVFMRRARLPGISRNPAILHGLYTGVHAAINLAALCGARKIVLLGVDLKPDGDRKYSYGGSVTPRTAEQFLLMRGALESCAPDLERLGIAVINGSPDSALRVWPLMSAEDALRA